MSRAESARCNSLLMWSCVRLKHVPRSVVRDAHERIVRCGLGIVPVSSETEDKFGDAMEVTASSPLPEIARVLLHFNHVASFIINANDCVM
jgi:hypothetical protein